MKRREKIALYLLPLLLFIQPAVKAQQVDSVHAEKARRILQRLLSNNPLPPQIMGDSSFRPQSNGPEGYSIRYDIERKEKNNESISKIMMVLFKGTMEGLWFSEYYHQSNKILPIYSYLIEDGMLQQAVCDWPVEHGMKEMIDTVGFHPKRVADELFQDSVLYIDVEQTKQTDDPIIREQRRQRDLKAQPFYLPKLYYSIDELYDLLFK